MKLISWNVNGLRACLQKGFLDFFKEADADIFCLQETKLQAGQHDLELPGYYQYWNYAEKKGYSGTALFTRKKPVNVTFGIGVEEHDHEGRVIAAEFEDFYVVTVYTPNSQRELARLDYRMRWEADFLAYLKKLEQKKPVIFCGDLNVAHQEIDLKNPKTNHQNAGFTDDERACFTRVLEQGFIDTYRYFYPDKTGVYSWWSYMFQSRSKNAGWRIDYFVVSKALEAYLKDAGIHTQVFGSDHCPVELKINFELENPSESGENSGSEKYPRLPRSFFTRDGITLAKDLLGKILVHQTEIGPVRGIITEVESYMGEEDKGSHTYGGRRTDRTEPMYHEGGTSYVYLIYGMYSCMNIAAMTEGIPQAVLIRGVVPADEESERRMLTLRMRHMCRKAGQKKEDNDQEKNDQEKNGQEKNDQEKKEQEKKLKKHLADGPGKMCIAMGITRDDNDIDMTQSDTFYVTEGIEVPASEIREAKRIGIDYAEEAADYLWRFYFHVK